MKNKLQRVVNGRFTVVHGMNGTATYRAWCSMINRCCNAKAQTFASYGGRGISVCKRWYDFRNFYADMGRAPSGLTLDRIDNNGPYCPENCRWATWKQQGRNRRTTVLITFHGEQMPLTAWAERLGIHKNTLRHRMKTWSKTKALTEPPHMSGLRWRNKIPIEPQGETI